MRRLIGVLAVAALFISLAFGGVDHQALRDPFGPAKQTGCTWVH